MRRSATSLLEDVALARAVKASGRRIFFRYGGDAVRTRMYRSFAQLRKAGRRIWCCCFHSPVRLAMLRLTEFVLIVAAQSCYCGCDCAPWQVASG